VTLICLSLFSSHKFCQKQLFYWFCGENTQLYFHGFHVYQCSSTLVGIVLYLALICHFLAKKDNVRLWKKKIVKKKKMMGENLWWSNTIRVSGFIHRHLIYIYDQSLEGNIGNCKLKRTGMVVHLLIMYLHSPMTLTVFLTSFPLSRCISVLSHQWLVSPSWFHSSYLPQIHYHHSPSLLSLFSFDYFILYTLWSIFF